MSYGRRAFPLLVLAAVACSGSDAFTPHPTASVREQPAKKYTMLLGNSLSFGFQPDKDVFNPAQFNTGFGTLFVERLNARVGRPRAIEVNLACPGETTETFVVGGCFYTDFFGLPLHTYYTGPQLEAAVAFLKAHPGQVNPIILAIGVNELYRPYLLDCQGDESCVTERIPKAIQSVTDNYDIILSRLRELAPQARLLILVEYRFPRFPESFNDGLAAIFERIRVAGAAYGAILVETDPIIQSDQCAMLFVCRENADIHPTDSGYRALSDALWAAFRRPLRERGSLVVDPNAGLPEPGPSGESDRGSDTESLR